MRLPDHLSAGHAATRLSTEASLCACLVSWIVPLFCPYDYEESARATWKTRLSELGSRKPTVWMRGKKSGYEYSMRLLVHARESDSVHLVRTRERKRRGTEGKL